MQLVYNEGLLVLTIVEVFMLPWLYYQCYLLLKRRSFIRFYIRKARYRIRVYKQIIFV